MTHTLSSAEQTLDKIAQRLIGSHISHLTEIEQYVLVHLLSLKKISKDDIGLIVNYDKKYDNFHLTKGKARKWA